MNANYLFSAMSWYFPWSLWKSKLLVSFYFLSCWVSALGLLLTRNIWFGFFFFYYAVCTVMNTFFLLRLQFLLHLGSNEAKQGGNVHLTMSHSRKKKIPPWYFLCWSQGSMCVWDITSHSEVCGRLRLKIVFLLVLFGDLQACFFPWDEYFFKGNMHFSACGHTHGENKLIWAVWCLAGYLSLWLLC